MAVSVSVLWCWTTSRWHEQIGDPIVADSFLDRVVQNAYRIVSN
jgi:hypothetical protein